MVNLLMKSKLLWPIVVLVVILLINLIFDPSFFSIDYRNGKLVGSLVDILNRGAPLILISIGMTLVIATKGIDLSVGSVIAMAGAIGAITVTSIDGEGLGPLFIAVGLTLIVSIIVGGWNGILVSRIGVQPIVATLILMVAGRGIAQLITGGQITTVYYDPYQFLGGGYLFALPFSIFIVTFVLLLALFLTRRTSLGLFIEAVGSNPEASRLAGLNSKNIMMMVYMFSGFCAGVGGLILSSNVMSADGNNAGLWFELDAILAVVIGGTSLMGGRFNLMGTLIGALIIQSLTTTIYSIGVPAETNLVIKAVVVLIVCLLQSPEFRRKIFGTDKVNKNRVKKESEGVTLS
ncbi:ABC transporter permease [Saliterribacillus persicus]|uniref:Monosaccharide ABC transporter membrane protein (CUT2 family) n=1 Tax=Saliterribacillus persicus TaxID=930114 RepID=A0A368Y3E2_9BACI|nr:ABC transporter permease [Saliterribacillus persicus]RCW74820.1 monosaccharide ABC transporter membrane protein (CUT2 family) [Saliterribacillus persicus]